MSHAVLNLHVRSWWALRSVARLLFADPSSAPCPSSLQQALAGGRDATRLPPGDLSLHVEGELAPPPFDALVQQ